MPQHRGEQWLLPTASVLLEPTVNLTAYICCRQRRRPSVLVQNAIADTTGELTETVDGGIRSWPGHDWQASVSVEQSHWRRLPLNVFESFIGFLAGEATDWSNLSANASLSGRLSQAFRFDASVTLNRARQTGPMNRSELLYPDVRLPDVAGVIARVGVNWAHSFGPELVARFDGSVRYEGASTATVGPIAIGRRQGDYIQTAMTLNLDRGADGLTISADNLFNARGTRYLLGNLAVAGTIVTPLHPQALRIAYRRAFGK